MKQEIIELDGMKIVVKELKVKTARKVMSNVMELFKGTVDVETLINDKYDLLIDIASDFIVIPDGHYIDDLTYSDLKNILYPAFKKVNQSFLDDVTDFIPMINPVEENPMNLQSKDSTKLSSD